MIGNLSDKEFFEARSTEYTYVSKVFPGFSPDPEAKRFIYRKLIVDGQEFIERVGIRGEYLLRRSKTDRLQVRLLVTQDEASLRQVVLQEFSGQKPTGTHFSFRDNELQVFWEAIHSAGLIDLSNTDKFSVPNADIATKGMGLSADERAFINDLRSAQGERRKNLLDSIQKSGLTKEDIEVLSGRRHGLEEFDKGLQVETAWTESIWQKFFEENTWIFGYGLDYRFLRILQKEASVSGVDLDGKNEMISDFLMGSSKFTVVVELKRPDTPLFGAAKDRSRSWALSTELTSAISQILAQKAEWDLKSRTNQFDGAGQPITQRTHDPKTVLVIGNTNQFAGDDRDSAIKA